MNEELGLKTKGGGPKAAPVARYLPRSVAPGEVPIQGISAPGRTVFEEAVERLKDGHAPPPADVRGDPTHDDIEVARAVAAQRQRVLVSVLHQRQQCRLAVLDLRRRLVPTRSRRCSGGCT